MIWKEALLDGNWRHRNGIFKCTPETRAYHARRTQEMIDAGLAIPVTWAHQPDIKPIPLSDVGTESAERVKRTIGHLAAVKNESVGPMMIGFDAPVQSDRERLPAVKYGSPYIEWDYVDPRGRLWPGPSITHYAIDPRPVQIGQKSFALSQEPLSLTDLAHHEPISLGESDMADDKEKKDEKKGEEVGGSLTDLIAALKEHGLNIPEEATDIPGLIIAIKAGKDTEPDEDDLDAPTDTPVETQTPPVMMSQAEHEERLAAALAPKNARIAELERGSLVGRIDKLLRKGKVDQKIHQKLKNQASAVSLSQGDTESDRFLAIVDAYEQLPGGAALPVTPKKKGPYESVSLAERENPGAVLDPDVMSRLTRGAWVPPKEVEDA